MNALASLSSTDDVVKYDMAAADNSMNSNVAWTVNSDISFVSGWLVAE